MTDPYTNLPPGCTASDIDRAADDQYSEYDRDFIVFDTEFFRPTNGMTKREITHYSRRIAELRRLDRAMIWRERMELTLIVVLMAVCGAIVALIF